MIRVLLADDQATVRGALAALLRLEKDIDVVAEVGRADDVLEAAIQKKPDVALLDIEMPGGDGLGAAARLREKLPSCRVLMLTTFGRPGYLRRAMEGGAVGFLTKDMPAAELASAIRRAVAGERVIDPQLAIDARLHHRPLRQRGGLCFARRNRNRRLYHAVAIDAGDQAGGRR